MWLRPRCSISLSSVKTEASIHLSLRESAVTTMVMVAGRATRDFGATGVVKDVVSLLEFFFLFFLVKVHLLMIFYPFHQSDGSPWAKFTPQGTYFNDFLRYLFSV